MPSSLLAGKRGQQQKHLIYVEKDMLALITTSLDIPAQPGPAQPSTAQHHTHPSTHCISSSAPCATTTLLLLRCFHLVSATVQQPPLPTRVAARPQPAAHGVAQQRRLVAQAARHTLPFSLECSVESGSAWIGGVARETPRLGREGLCQGALGEQTEIGGARWT